MRHLPVNGRQGFSAELKRFEPTASRSTRVPREARTDQRDGPRRNGETHVSSGEIFETGERGSKLQEVSRAMVGLYKEQFGRGPTKARAEWAGNDVLICLLQDSLTRAERNLRGMGEHQRLRDSRTSFQYATVKDFVGAVERIMGRTVQSFVSGIDTETDLSCEVFVF